MRIVAVSDLHGHLPPIPECDLCLIAGDVCPVYNHRVDFQRLWLHTNFNEWLKSIPARAIIGVWGNHDLIGEVEAVELNWTLLQDSLTEFEGLKIYGLPWQLRFYDWAFNLDEPELSAKYDQIPPCDIIVSHGPPFGYGDLTLEGVHAGCKAFNDAINKHQPKLAVFGHIHEGWGHYQLGTTQLINVSYLNRDYCPNRTVTTICLE